MTGYLYKIKKIVISVDRKKYTKNEINISDKVIAGVASGISNYFRVDPIIFRIIL